MVRCWEVLVGEIQAGLEMALKELEVETQEFRRIYGEELGINP